MERVTIGDLGVVVPLRIDSRERLENLTAVLAYHRDRFPELDFHLVEDAPEPRTLDLAARFGARHHFFRNRKHFHKTRLLNRAFFELTDRPALAVLDTDVLLHPAAVKAALARLSDGAGVVQPFDGRFYEVTGSARQAVLDTPLEAEALLERLSPEPAPPDGVKLMNRDCAGASVFFLRSALERFGGYCELFTRWGFEDDEILMRARRFGFPLARVAGWPLLHLAHPRVLANWSWYWMGGINRRLLRSLERKSLDEIEAMKRKGLMGKLNGLDHPGQIAE